MRECCCCFSLRAGTVTMGILNLIGSIAGIILITPAVASIREARVDLGTVYVSSGSVHSGDAYQPANQGFRTDNLLADALAVALLIYMLLTAFTSALMIYGALRRVSQCVFPWLALNFTSNVYLACAMVTIAIVMTMNETPPASVTSLAGTLLGTALNFYIWLSVFSYYQELVGAESQQRTQPHIGKIISAPPVYATYIQ